MKTSRDLLALVRTILANERTLLAYARTALGFFMGGIGLIKLLEHPFLIALGWLLIVLGIVLGGVGVRRFYYSRRHFAHLRPERYRPAGNSR